jgi:TetR/AcrR family acrAB operon transcriptional repressor
MLKVEFVDELDVVRCRRQHSLNQWMARVERRIKLAADQGLISCKVEPRMLALAMWTMIDGLVRNWMFAPQSFDLLELGKSVIDPYMAGLRAGRA